VRCIRYLTQVRGVNLAGVKLLFQMRGAAELLQELASLIGEADEAETDFDSATRQKAVKF